MFSNVLRRDTPSDVTKDVSLPFSSSAAEETFSIMINGIRKLQDAKILRVGNPLLLTNVFRAYSHGVAVLALDKHLKHAIPLSYLMRGLTHCWRHTPTKNEQEIHTSPCFMRSIFYAHSR
jgi:hypothetical protein